MFGGRKYEMIWKIRRIWASEDGERDVGRILDMFDNRKK